MINVLCFIIQPAQGTVSECLMPSPEPVVVQGTYYFISLMFMDTVCLVDTVNVNSLS